MAWARATRNLSQASDADLTAMRDAAKLLMDHERRISPRVLTELCLIREETGAELHKHVDMGRDGAIDPIARTEQRSSH
jgi:hypothetical protein